MAKFMFHGFSITDMVALIGVHTIGLARCRNFRERIYGDFEGTIDQSNPISESYLKTLKSGCSAVSTGRDDDNTTAMDYVTPYIFDNSSLHQFAETVYTVHCLILEGIPYCSLVHGSTGKGL